MAIVKKGNKFYYRFQHNGKEYYRACKGATSMKDAQLYESVVRGDLMRGDLRVLDRKEKITIAKLIQIFMEYSEANKASSKNDEYFCKRFKSYFGAHKIINEIKPQDIEMYKIMRLKNVKASSVNRELNSLKKMFSMAVDNGYIEKTPCTRVKHFRVENTKMRVLSKEEEIRLNDKIKFPYLRLIVKMALLTGMRKEEILSLKMEHVDLDEDFITILKTKNSKARQVPLAKSLKNELLKLKRDSGYIFVNEKTQKRYTTITKAFNQSLSDANISGMTFHDLRHTAATRMVEYGIDLVTVAEILGHSDLKMVMRYAHPVVERKIKAIEYLDTYCG